MVVVEVVIMAVAGLYVIFSAELAVLDSLTGRRVLSVASFHT